MYGEVRALKSINAMTNMNNTKHNLILPNFEANVSVHIITSVQSKRFFVNRSCFVGMNERLLFKLTITSICFLKNMWYIN